MEYSLSKDKLSKGWSYPLKRSLLDELLGGILGVKVRRVYYMHYMNPEDNGRTVLWVTYSGSLAIMHQETYSIVVCSVPTELKHEIGTKLLGEGLPFIHEWILALEQAPMTTRDKTHRIKFVFDGEKLLKITEENY